MFREIILTLIVVSALSATAHAQKEARRRFTHGLRSGGIAPGGAEQKICGYMPQVAIARGLSARFLANFLFKAGAAFVPGYDGKTHPVWNAGIHYSF
jgi:hypothetical protein